MKSEPAEIGALARFLNWRSPAPAAPSEFNTFTVHDATLPSSVVDLSREQIASSYLVDVPKPSPFTRIRILAAHRQPELMTLKRKL